ncbi:MAG: NADH-ubiquinone oxidoreductase complex I, 21 kDa subunit-domain-containing protein [Lentinula lateritia]|uniref:NADH-ubiquinone oxidoreductase complex I, 21 kDa subunit-domain-containing protein n=1 Tax=Lentinula lateritia TaxID=40482 RepID=A0ABQ8V950_9AGAR|nr:MAG: NADH-ubiquinone oxidoreductase complex I, 21 kDa subunit-domain-containing protein [Lentinula lateritia]KAJ4474572.1 NADH-ubiquinone oxidoreductase complex I, 21 kDa subunit-domain-containing protein [Lentinula lateritia]
MPEKVLNTPYPVIDIDPHFTRVVRYFRATDYATWGATTVGVPGALLAWEILDPNGLKINRITLSPTHKLPAGRIAMGNAIQIVTRRMVAAMRVAAFLGACGGFLLAYQNSSMRFLGFTENAREAQMDLIELSQRAREGKPLYGESHQSPWVQGAAHRNSVFSMLKFSAFPMFNFVNHPHHGVDTSKYGVGVGAKEVGDAKEAEE